MTASARHPADARPRVSRGLVIGAFVVAVAVVAVGLTWWRLWWGADLVDEAFNVLVPWRWSLGDTPFVNEQNLTQVAGMLAYPFVKLFAVIRHDDPTGLVLYGRHLYLALAVATAVSVAYMARRRLSWALAVLVALPFATVVLFETPQLTPNTWCALLLSVAASLGGVFVLGGGRRFALASGAVFGLACVAYPTVVLIAPFVGVCLAFSLGRRVVGLIARESIEEPVAPGDPDGARRAWRALSVWTLGFGVVVVPVGLVAVGVAGLTNLRRCWGYTLGLADHLDQLGGASKAVDVAESFVSLLGREWYVVVAAALSLLILRLRPGLGRWLLLLTPLALWVTATTGQMQTAGAVVVYALAAPFLFLFVPRARRVDGARLLCWVWVPALIVGAMVAYTSADGFVHGAVGLLPGMMVSGMFLAWGFAPARSERTSWLPVVGLAAVVAVTLVLQGQFLYGGVGRQDLAVRMESGPWKGIALTRAQSERLAGLTSRLAEETRAGDSLLVYPEGAAYYLSWPGPIAANTYQMYSTGSDAPLPKSTLSYYRRHHVVPSLVVHLVDTHGKQNVELEQVGDFGYPLVVVRPWYTLSRKPAGSTVQDVLDGLPRL